MLRIILKAQKTILNTQPRFFFAVNTTSIQKIEDFKILVTDNKKPVIVDFYADWCGPCKQLDPKFKEKTKNSDGWDFVKLDIDNFGELAEMMNISSIPTVILFHNGKSVDQFVGLDENGLNRLVKQAENLGK